MTLDAFRSAVLDATGGAPDVIEPGRFLRFATNGKRGDTAGWCRLFDDCRAGVYGCHRQQVSATWLAENPRRETPAERAARAHRVERAQRERDAVLRAERAENARRIAATWARCVPLVPGDPVTLYLKARGFAGVWPLPKCLRHHPALDYWRDGERIGTLPAMVAPLTAPDGRIVALHRTWLTRDGRKADVPTVRKLTRAAGPLAGGCILLFTPKRGVIGIAEGIETALASSLASGIPTVAAYSAGNVAAWQWPASARRIVVFADNDKAGREAADTLRARALRAGLRVEVAVPSSEGDDWADVWTARAGATA